MSLTAAPSLTVIVAPDLPSPASEVVVVVGGGPTLRVLVIVQTTSAPSATDTFSGPLSEPLARTSPAPLADRHSIAEV